MKDNLKKLIDEYTLFYHEYYDKELDPLDVGHKTNASSILDMIEHIPSKKSRILEYGCANGFNLRFLQREGFTNLTGIDAFIENDSAKGIKHIKANFAKDEISGVYDFIFCRGVLQQGAFKSLKLIDNSEDDVLKIITTFEKLLTKDGIIWFSEGPVRDWIKLFGSKNFIVTNISTNPNVYISKKIKK